MYAKQFTELLSLFKEQQDKLISGMSAQVQVESILNSTVNGRKTSELHNNMSNVATFKNFDARKEQFSSYLERFKNYSSMKGLKEKLKSLNFFVRLWAANIIIALLFFWVWKKPLKSLDYSTLVNEIKK